MRRVLSGFFNAGIDGLKHFVHYTVATRYTKPKQI